MQFISLLFALLLAGSPEGRPIESAALSRQLVGSEFLYSVVTGDSFARISARFGVDPSVLATQNALSIRTPIQPGQVLRIDNRHVVPALREDGILINVPQRLLFYFESGNLVAWYPVGMGRPDWPTPLGQFVIGTKEHDPVWDVPRSIQQEMRREGKKVETRVPPGPRNPLGEYWMGLTPSSCGIHGTTAPTSVYRFQTHGCIRLHPDDIADLFPRVSVGTPVEIVYRPLLAARLDDGSAWVEAHPDVYRKEEDFLVVLDAFETSADFQRRAREAMRRREGIAVRID